MPVPAHPGRQEVAVVRHPIADARNIVVGYELRFGGSVDLGDPAMDAKATSALLVEAFGDIGLETLAGRHPAWVTIARNFLVEIGPPPVRPDRAVLQIKAYSARDDLLQILQRLARSGYTIALDEYDGALIDNVEELMGLCSIVRVDVSKVAAEDLPRVLRVPKMQGAMLVATEVGDHAAFERCKALGFTYFQGEYFAQPRTFRHRGVATAGPRLAAPAGRADRRRRLLRGPRADHRVRRRPVAEAAALRELGLLRAAAHGRRRCARR